MTTATSGRVYGGLTAEERAAQRRSRLLAAGLEVFGTVGYAGATQRAVLQQAGLGERYFEESFADLEDLLAAVHVQVCADVAAEVLAAMADAAPDLETQVRVGLAVFTRATLRDRRRARVQLLEAVGTSPALEQVRRDTRHAFASIVAEHLAPLSRPGGLDLDLVAVAVVGAVDELLRDVVLDRVHVEEDRLVEHLVRLVLAMGRTLDVPGRPS